MAVNTAIMAENKQKLENRKLLKGVKLNSLLFNIIFYHPELV